MIYKIAVVTEDGQRISNHFGMAPLYRVFTVEGNQILQDEQRPKVHHSHHPHSEDQQAGHSSSHADMFAPIGDCQILLSGGMGQPAYQKALSAGLEVVLTGGEIQQAVQDCLKGQTTSDMRRIHIK